MFKLALIVASVVVAVKSDCSTVPMADDVCAILFDEPDCIDKMVELKEGEKKLGFANNNDAESVAVNKGCTFRGYDEDGESFLGIKETLGLRDAVDKVEERGEATVVTALKDTRGYTNIEGDNDEDISYVSCRCGNTGENGKCAKVPPYLCAIAYDEHGCDKGDWDAPLEIPETEKFNLGFRKYFNQRNGIESITVRAGCTLKGYDDTDLDGSDGSITIVAPPNADLNMDLKGDKDLQNNIESMSCRCDKN